MTKDEALHGQNAAAGLVNLKTEPERGRTARRILMAPVTAQGPTPDMLANGWAGRPLDSGANLPPHKKAVAPHIPFATVSSS